MDYVYVFKPGIQNSIELRYSLRSLKNIRHDSVYIIGTKPYWVKNVIHIPYQDWPNRLQNVREKYKIICDTPEISKNFVLMNDDFYIMNKVKKLEYYHRWKIIYVLNKIKPIIGITRFYKALESVWKLFPRGDCYSTHTPMMFNKEKFKYIMDNYWDKLMCKKSLYCNYYWVEGVKIKDVKIHTWSDATIWDENYLSSSDESIEDVLEHLAITFPRKCKYEIFNLNNTLPWTKNKRKNLSVEQWESKSKKSPWISNMGKGSTRR